MITDKFELAFRQYHLDNPEVYEYFKLYALQASTVRNKIGTKAIIERIRWQTMIDTHSKDGFKINNNHAAFYSRMFIKDFPEHKGLFNFRTRKVCQTK